MNHRFFSTVFFLLHVSLTPNTTAIWRPSKPWPILPPSSRTSKPPPRTPTSPLSLHSVDPTAECLPHGSGSSSLMFVTGKKTWVVLFLFLATNDVHFFIRALAASAPVAQFDAPCDAFGRIVTSDYSQIGKECSQTIRESWKAVDNLTSTGNFSHRFKIRQFANSSKINWLANFWSWKIFPWTVQ